MECVCVQDEGEEERISKYTLEMLQSVFQFVGIRPKPAKKLAKLVFSHVPSSVNSNITRQAFTTLVKDSLLSLGYRRPQQLLDFATACGIRERKRSVTIILCGTSGTGKSTLASLLASRLGITSILSTDSIRHMLRSFDPEKENKFIWSSTYDAASSIVGLEAGGKSSTNANMRKAVIRGYKAQSEMVMDHLNNLISHCSKRRESLIVEGVHLSMHCMIQLMKQHESVLPFLIFISNEQKHKERFAVRARAMALTPMKNKYVNHFRNIRIIQDYLCKKADKHLIPKIDNSNIDRSVAAIHTIVLSVLRCGMVDPAALHSELEKLNQGHVWGGKDMLQLIRQKKAVEIKDGDHKNLDNIFYSTGRRKLGQEYNSSKSPRSNSSRDLGLSSDDGLHLDLGESPDESGETSHKDLMKLSDPTSDVGSIIESHEDSFTS